MISWYLTSVLTRSRSYTERTTLTAVGPYNIRYTITEMTGITMKIRIRFRGLSVWAELEDDRDELEGWFVLAGDSDKFLRRLELRSPCRFLAICFGFSTQYWVVKLIFWGFCFSDVFPLVVSRGDYPNRTIVKIVCTVTHHKLRFLIFAIWILNKPHYCGLIS